MKHPPAHVFEFTPESLTSWLSQRGMPAFRARQVLEWVYDKRVIDPAQMTNLSARDRDLLADPEQGLTFLSGDVIADRLATDGTRKLLVQWIDGSPTRGATLVAGSSTIALPILNGGGSGQHAASQLDTRRQTECVMIPAGGDRIGPVAGRDWNDGDDSDRADDAPKTPSGAGERSYPRHRRTACISSQVGCPVGCRFCASGIGGLDGNLSTGRIVEQVWRLGSPPAATPSALSGDPGSGPRDDPHAHRISNVVFMGMGEPLSNFQNVVSAVRLISAPWGLGIGARRITISTVGLPKAIERLADELDVPVTLALSLHAPNDAIRRELIPWAEYTTIPDLLKACQKWFTKTRREITLEYILLQDVNDRAEHARELVDVARSIRANVNLIRYNEVRGMPFERPRDERVHQFQRILREAGVNTHIRASRGRDIAAACGQLRHEVRAGSDAVGIMSA
jgi:23S rRNA (adenine2503-C2)-methyltransferase